MVCSIVKKINYFNLLLHSYLVNTLNTKFAGVGDSSQVATRWIVVTRKTVA